MLFMQRVCCSVMCKLVAFAGWLVGEVVNTPDLGWRLCIAQAGLTALSIGSLVCVGSNPTLVICFYHSFVAASHTCAVCM